MAVTPTFEEYLWSHVKWPWEKIQVYDLGTPWEDQETIDYRAEMALYHNIDLALIGTGVGIHAYFHGGFAATNTVHFYRLMSAMNTAGSVARVATPLAVMASPMLVGYAATSAAIERAPVQDQPSLWRSVSQALIGTGPGVGTWQY